MEPGLGLIGVLGLSSYDICRLLPLSVCAVPSGGVVNVVYVGGDVFVGEGGTVNCFAVDGSL